MKVLAVTAFLAALIGVPQANATIEIRLINPTVAGADTGWLVFAGNTATFNGPVGNWDINVSTSIQDDGTDPVLDLNSVDHALIASPGGMIIETIANGYAVGSPGYHLDVGGTLTAGTAAAFQDYGGNNDLVCAAGVNTCSPASLGLATTGGPLTFASLGGAFSGSKSGPPGNTVNPYSLAILAVLDPKVKGSNSFDAGINTVPEPASVLLFGGALLLTATALRKKLRKA